MSAIRKAATIVSCLAVLPFSMVVFAQAPAPPPQAPNANAGRGGRGGSALVSPEISADRRVTFRLRAPNAREVSVTGLAVPLAMTKDEQGVWSATTDPLPPDIYEYRFSVDGAAVSDPGNSRVAGGTSLLYVPGALWTTSADDIPHGAIAKHAYQSALMGGTEEYEVYTPPDYDHARRQPYPIFVVLHGLGGQADDWIGHGGANLTLDTLIAQKKAVPMILVSPHSQGKGNAAADFPIFTNTLLTEILPRVEREYNASTARADHAITGLSMGGAQSLLLLNHLDQFAWVGAFSPGFDMFDPAWGTGRGAGAPAQPAPAGHGAARGARGDAAGAAPRQRPVLADGILARAFPALDHNANAQLKLLYAVCGTADDHLELTRQFRDFLTSRTVNVKYLEVPNATHTWPIWRAQFAEMAQMIFKNGR